MCGLQKDPLFQQFVILVSLEGLENKYNLELSRGMSVYFVFWCMESVVLLVAFGDFYICTFRLEGAKEPKVFGFCD